MKAERPWTGVASDPSRDRNGNEEWVVPMQTILHSCAASSLGDLLAHTSIRGRMRDRSWQG